MTTQHASPLSPYLTFDKKEWAELRAETPMTLDAEDLERLSGVIERVSEQEVIEIYLPLSRLLNFYVGASQALHAATSRFLGQSENKTPFIIGIAGSVAAGKSTTARVLQALLSRWTNSPRVDLVSTDGFLLPNAVLEERGIMNRKGFPESFDTRALLHFLAEVKAGRPQVQAPLYSHFHYDVLPDRTVCVDRPDILIVEGLNLLQPAKLPTNGEAIPFVSDFFDFSVYIDADPEVIGEWYVERFMQLRKTAFSDPAAYFYRYSKLSDTEARETARHIWETINLANLKANILPTRQRARLILHKIADHTVQTVHLRKI